MIEDAPVAILLTCANTSVIANGHFDCKSFYRLARKKLQKLSEREKKPFSEARKPKAKLEMAKNIREVPARESLWFIISE